MKSISQDMNFGNPSYLLLLNMAFLVPAVSTIKPVVYLFLVIKVQWFD